MSTSPLYLTTRARLAQHLPQALPSQLDTMGYALVGIVQSMSSQLAKIARAMPLTTTALAKEQRLRRLLDNERITQDTHYHPLVTQSLHGLRGQRVQLLMDRVLLRDTHNILVVSLAFRRRSIPLVWRALPHRGSSNPTEQIELFHVAVKLLPPNVRVSVHADSEFRSEELFGWVRTQGYDAMLGIQGHIWVYETAEPGADGQSLGSRVAPLPPQTATGRKRTHRISPVTYLTQVYLGKEHRGGPVNIIAWWERDKDDKVVLHAIKTNLPATAHTKAYGRRRMWIETVFRDWQSGGFHLDESGLVDTGRVLRLLLVLAIAYVWLVSVGRWVVKRSYRCQIDDGSKHHWHFSLFQLGVGWKEHLASYAQPLPVLFHVYV